MLGVGVIDGICGVGELDGAIVIRSFGHLIVTFERSYDTNECWEVDGHVKFCAPTIIVKLFGLEFMIYCRKYQ